MTIKFETKSGIFEVEPRRGLSVLFAGLADGLTLPHECATGTCGTCRARVMSGSVQNAWPAAPGAGKIKPEKGDVLMCQSHPAGDCVLRVPSEVRRSEGQRPGTTAVRLDRLERLTHDVMHFDVVAGGAYAFEAGQFVVCRAPELTGGRAYSMVNDAAPDGRLSFVVKRKPGGGFSDWLFEAARAGDEIELFGPLGAATLRDGDDNDLIVIAGGSGIAGMMAILVKAQRSGYLGRRKAQVFFGVRTLADGFYLDRLSELVAASNGALDVTLALSHEVPAQARHPQFPAIKLADRFVHEAAQRALPAGSGASSLGFLAGPPPMVDGAVRMLLMHAGVGARAIRYDKFG